MMTEQPVDSAALLLSKWKTKIKEKKPVVIDTQTPATCRICQRGDDREGSLLTPCNCKGVFSHAHSSCLSQWIEANDMPYCDICHFPYIVDKRPHTLRDWSKMKGKTEEYQTAFMAFLTSLYNFFLAGIIFSISYANIWPCLSFLLSGCIVFWFIYMTGGVLVTSWRQYQSYKDWSSTHFRYKVRNNPKHGLRGERVSLRNAMRSTGIKGVDVVTEQPESN